jgi:hypothetical protein
MDGTLEPDGVGGLDESEGGVVRLANALFLLDGNSRRQRQ